MLESNKRNVRKDLKIKMNNFFELSEGKIWTNGHRYDLRQKNTLICQETSQGLPCYNMSMGIGFFMFYWQT